MHAFLAAVAVVALAEVGDKTMLLALVLATRLRAPWQIMAGILTATIANHTLAALVGSEAAGLLEAPWFRLAVALGFIAMGVWTLIPDKLDEDADNALRTHGGAYLTTVVSFFFVEMGDKTQIATIALAAHYHSIFVISAGTTLGLMIADGFAVLAGETLVERISMRAAHAVAAVLFIALGLWQLASTAGWVG
ncbi:MAG: TMEM165/GDT1 family protein [Novosphingobium sp.]|nr:TMEM165/GDT1 family protein [Novosphingobium sp.]